MMTNKLILTCLSAFASLATTSAQEVADTTIVLNYGYEVVDDNSLAKRCSIIAVPTYVLLDPEGKILMWTMAGLDNVEDYLE